MGRKCKKSKKISNFFVFSSLIIIIVISGVCIIKDNFFKTEKTRNINISYLSDEFVDKYFKEISENNSNEDKDNMLIVISKSKIKNSYGAKNIGNLPVSGSSKTITLRDLKDEGFVEEDIANPETKKKCADTMHIRITNNNGDIEYTIVESTIKDQN